MTTVDLAIPTAEWALPHLKPARYKGAKGSRSSGKSHFFAEMVVERMVSEPDLRVVCIREIQRSLKFSAKSLIEHKITKLGVEDHFEILSTEIRRVGGDGICIFEGMQDHTADSLKSLEGFGVAWVEEAQRLSRRSLKLLTPTIRAEGSEIWFSWNPDQEDDPVETFFRDLESDGRVEYTLTHNTYLDNPFCPPEAIEDAERTKRLDPDAYEHVWLGGYNLVSDAQVLRGRWRVDEFEASSEWDGPYFGADWGYSNDPTILVKCWIGDNRLWVEYEAGGVGIGLDDVATVFKAVPGAERHKIRADASRPETIAHVSKGGLDVEAAPKWKGSVEDGVEFLKSFEEIVIHERCGRAQEEARLWRYKTDRLTGDPLPKLADGHDHIWDSVRYSLSPIIRTSDEKKVTWRAA